MSKKKENSFSPPKDDTLIYESVTGKDNIVKVISFDEGKRHEVLVYVISEKQFEDLIPDSENMKESVIAIAK